ncbi:MAG: carboxypeptidase regulatory-like domain-containing protein [Candidatus Acidiferrales bacterium]
MRRVVLYKNGVGYFEHVGEVRGSENVRIDFTSRQLNDVLKSLTILDLNGGRITGVDYNSEAPLGQLLGALRLPLGEKTTVAQFLGALRGARLEIHSGSATITGRLLSVERKSRVSGGTTLEVDVISVVTDAGEVREVEITPAVSARVLEPDMNQEIGRYLGLLASERDQDLRRLVISTAGNGERKLYVSYISEVPIWKSTYRIVLPSKPDGQALLQGWGIVDNTVGEDWDNVQLTLVSGAPQSFIMQLSQPYYARRPEVALPEGAQPTPQTHEGTMIGGFSTLSGTLTDSAGAAIGSAQVRLMSNSGQLLATTTTDAGGNYQFEDLPEGMFQLEFQSNGFQTARVGKIAVNRASESKQDVSMQIGSSSQTVTVNASVPSTQTENGDVGNSARSIGSGGALGSGRGLGRGGKGVASGEAYGLGGGYPAAGTSVRDALLKTEVGAEGQELGDLFEYRVKEPVTIHKNQSSLVPILQANVDAERVSVWNPTYTSARPLRALWITNSSPLTLDGGSFSILEDETFAGEGLMDSIKPGEKRLISYAADLGMRVSTNLESAPQRVRHLKISHGVMIQTSELREKSVYLVRNEDTSPRTIVIEHPVRPGWKPAVDAPKPDEASAGYYRFRLNVAPKSVATLSVSEAKPLDARFEITNLNSEQIAVFHKVGSIDPDVEQALQKILEQKQRVAALDAELSKRNDEKDSIYDDQQRLRENLKSLKGSPEERSLTQRYIQQLNDQETRLQALGREIADLLKQQHQAQDELDKMIERLSFDADI